MTAGSPTAARQAASAAGEGSAPERWEAGRRGSGGMGGSGAAGGAGNGGVAAVTPHPARDAVTDPVDRASGGRLGGGACCCAAACPGGRYSPPPPQAPEGERPAAASPLIARARAAAVAPSAAHLTPRTTAMARGRFRAAWAEVSVVDGGRRRGGRGGAACVSVWVEREKGESRCSARARRAPSPHAQRLPARETGPDSRHGPTLAPAKAVICRWVG